MRVDGAAGVGMCGMGPVNLTRVTGRGPWGGERVLFGWVPVETSQLHGRGGRSD